MAFCKQCGADLNGANFCPSCGTAANADIVAAQPQNVAPVGAESRERSLAAMEHMMSYFGAKQTQYDECDAAKEEIASRTGRGFLWILLVGLVITIIALSKANTALFLWSLPVAIAVFVLLRKNNKKKLEAARIKEATLTTELNDYYVAYGYCPVGYEYSNPRILYKINEIIRIGRANNPGDAINILLDDLHKEKMENEAQATRIAAEEGAKQSKKAARYSAANFWFKD